MGATYIRGNAVLQVPPSDQIYIATNSLNSILHKVCMAIKKIRRIALHVIKREIPFTVANHDALCANT